jgi:hypothetical protein
MPPLQTHSLIEFLLRRASRLVLCFLISSGAGLFVPLPCFAGENSSTPCTQKEYRQFDFWVGEWDVSDFDNPTVINARVHVDRILDGCVLHESYQDMSGTKGESFSIYDATTHTWHQSWVTNRGRLLLLDGGLTAEGMVLRGEDRTSEGKKRIVRGTWKATQDGVRETALVSLDDGRSWMPWFDLIFRPHKP